MSTTVLIIDDDHKLNELLRDYLSQFGITVLTTEHPDHGLTLLQKAILGGAAHMTGASERLIVSRKNWI